MDSSPRDHPSGAMIPRSRTTTSSIPNLLQVAGGEFSMPTTGEYSLPDDTSYRMNVVELEVPPCLTTLTVRTHEGALPLVSLPYRTPNVRWNVPPPHAGSGSARPGRGTELLSLQLKDQGFKGPIEHLRNIPAHH